METLDTKGAKNTTFSNNKIQIKLVCEFCNYSTSRKSHYDRHILTPKHAYCTTVVPGNGSVLKKYQTYNDVKYKCKICNKNYQNRSGLWK